MADRGRKTITYCPLYTITYSTLAIKILDWIKQLFRDVRQNRCCKFPRKTLVSKSLFNKVAGL